MVQTSCLVPLNETCSPQTILILPLCYCPMCPIQWDRVQLNSIGHGFLAAYRPLKYNTVRYTTMPLSATLLRSVQRPTHRHRCAHRWIHGHAHIMLTKKLKLKAVLSVHNLDVPALSMARARLEHGLPTSIVRPNRQASMANPYGTAPDHAFLASWIMGSLIHFLRCGPPHLLFIFTAPPNQRSD